MLSEDALHQDFDFSAGAWKARPLLRSRCGAEGPINSDALADLSNHFGGDDFDLIFAHRFDGAVVRGERFVERCFVVVVVQCGIDAALGRGALSISGNLQLTNSCTK